MSGSKDLLGSRWASYPVDLAEAVGSVASAIFIKEIAHWTTWSTDGWVFRSHDEIRAETGLTRRVQETARKHLRNHALLQEEHRGMPRRLYYQVDFDAIDRLLDSTPPVRPDAHDVQHDVQNVQTDAPNVQTDLYASKDASKSVGVSNETPSGKPQIVGISKYLVDRFYDAMREEGFRLPNEHFPYHLGRANDILEKDSPTDQEIEDLPQWFVRTWKIKGKADAHSALMEMRRQGAREEVLAERTEKEPPHPHSAEAQAARDKPRSITWYLSCYNADGDVVLDWINSGLAHSQIVARLEGAA